MFKKLERAYWKKKQKKWNVTNQQITTTQSNHYLLPEVGEGFWEIIWVSGGMERGWGGGGGSQSSHIEYKGGIVEDWLPVRGGGGHQNLTKPDILVFDPNV